MKVLLTAISVAGEIGRTLGIEHVKANLVPRDQRVDWLAGHFEAVKSLGLREDSWVTFQQPNITAEVRDIIATMNTPPLFYLALEVSRTGNSEHLFRVTDHARIVSLATGLEAYPAIVALRLTDHLRGFVGDRMYQDVHQFIEDRGPEDAYWYRSGPSDAADWR